MIRQLPSCSFILGITSAKAMTAEVLEAWIEDVVVGTTPVDGGE